MRNSVQLLLIIFIIAVGGAWFGVVGLALAGIATGMMLASSKHGFLLGGTTAALFWLTVAMVKIVNGQSQLLLSLAASLAQLSGAKIWFLVLASSIIAFLAGGLGGWLGGSLRQVIHRAAQPEPKAL
ncbi:MAG: hypothetical protein ACREOI_14475 [bacterium]